MERVIGVNPVLEVLNNREKTIEKLEIYKGVRGEILQKIQRLASERNVKIFYTNKKVENSQGFCILDRKSTRLNSSHANISYAVFCLQKNNTHLHPARLSLSPSCSPLQPSAT